VKNNYTETISVKLDNFSSHDSSIGFYIKQKGKFYFDYKTISAENKENMEIILEPSQEIYILMYTEDIEGNINVEANFASFKSKESRDLISSVIMISLPLLVIIWIFGICSVVIYFKIAKCAQYDKQAKIEFDFNKANFEDDEMSPKKKKSKLRYKIRKKKTRDDELFTGLLEEDKY